MKLNKACLLALGLIASSSPVFAQQSNFQFMPAPIAYPYFEPGRRDINLGVDTFGVSGGPEGATELEKIDLTGAGAHLILRGAINEKFALSGGFGAYGMSGDVPGFALPVVDGAGNIYTAIIDGKGDLSGFGMPFFANLELQPINKPGGNLLLFAGPNLAFAYFTADTPYHGQRGAVNLARTNFRTTATAFLGGVQFGAQVGLKLGSFRVAPFGMWLIQSGSASFTFDDGYTGNLNFSEGLVETADIEPFVIQVFGFDVVYEPWNLSLGGVFQKTNDKELQEGYETTMFSLSYHFRKK
jgi:hypothetical protein